MSDRSLPQDDTFPSRTCYSQIRDLGEQGLLERLQRFCPQDIVGDDAAVMPSPSGGQSLVVTTDVLVDGVHFSDRTTSPYDVGWRAAAANLSDLAAMGASPLGITVGLSLPGDVLVSWVEQLYQGMTNCLEQYNTPIVGGDICCSPVITVAITAFGQALPHRTIRRCSAQVGDAIVSTGVHGASRAGLELLLNPEFGINLTPAQRLCLIQAHQRPQPRLDVLLLLWNILDSWFPTLGSPISLSGMDSSDGLADAIVQICRASGVGAVIERSKISVPPLLSQILSPQQAWDWVLYGGEDFELVLCLPDELAQTLVEQLGQGAAVIGQVTTGGEVWLKDSTGTYGDELLTLTGGFQHFRC
ncbi:MAG TPA: thiamine-phosphate kinase [Cyanobacteria bacterium UBA8803]|nr:thiamine-phosphate kinase [Cyanobacteria bacterium UBA9273]HBL61510.1 thiamine-phosphate kinase [Cyanobacteria bacterium UBA8803]